MRIVGHEKLHLVQARMWSRRQTLLAIEDGQLYSTWQNNPMDRLMTLNLFVRIVERASFSAAAADLGVSRPAATAAVNALETRLDTRLLQRNTRHVSRPSRERHSIIVVCKF